MFLNETVPSNKLDAIGIQTQLNFLRKKILRIVDAAYSNAEQNLAIKELITQEFDQQTDWMMNLASGTTGVSIPNGTTGGILVG